MKKRPHGQRRSTATPATAPTPIMITAGGNTMTAAEWLRLARSKVMKTERDQAPVALSAKADSPGLEARDIEAVFDALVAGGCPRGKSWVLNFLKAAYRRSQGAMLAQAEVAQALQRLASGGRIREIVGHGFAVPADAAAARLPALLSGEHAALLWRWALWAAGDGHGKPDDLPAWVQFRSRDEMVAVLRLVVYGGMSVGAYGRLMNGPLRPAADHGALLHAVTAPFLPTLFDRMESALRLQLIDHLDPLVVEAGASPLHDWLSDWVDRAPSAPPLHLCYRIAERRMHALDLAGMHAALAGHPRTEVHELFAAAELAVAGRWPEAAAGFAAAYKARQAAANMRRGAAPSGLTWIYPMALLAQRAPAAWLTARKFCVAESGTRDPSPHEKWGRWAHAAKVRLGDDALVAEAFALHESEGVHQRVGAGVDIAHRLLLTAWLGVPALGWTTAGVARLLDGLIAVRRFWLARLVVQACVRLKIAVVTPDFQGTPEPAAFFGDEREVWRDALAVITALGEQSAGALTKAAPSTTLTWQLQVDAEGRVVEVQPFERTLGVRGWSRPKSISLAKIRKHPRLDARDAAVARSIESRRNSSLLTLNPVAAAQALVHHPAVTFADAPAQLVELAESLPTLEVSRRGGAARGAKAGAQAGAGAESFVFRIDPPLLARSVPHVAEDARSDAYHSDAGYEASVERLNSIRVVRDAPDRARLIRITAAQRRVAELVAKDWSVPVEARDELDAALRVLSGHFQLHSDAAAGEEVAGDSRLRAQLSPQGDGLHLRLVVMPFGAFGPAVPPGVGRERLMTMHEGLSLTTVRALAVEAAHWRAVIEALPFLDDGSAPDAGWMLDDPEQALRAVEALPALPGVAALDWPRGKPLRVVSVDSAALGVQVASGRDWFALQGEVRVDEQRVLTLQHVMELAREARSRFVALGDGQYLALSDRLRRQLADLDAAGRVDKDSLKLPLAAAAWLDEALEGATVKSDGGWQRRIAALAGAAALTPVVEGLQTELRTYQSEGFAWMARLAHAGLGACLADDMGLGKTIQTLALLLRRAGDGPALVLAPTSVCANWVAETAKFAPALNARLYGERDDAGRAALLGEAGPYDVIVASYALAHVDNALFGGRAWTTLVLDEAQALKNSATQRARAVAAIDAGFRLALSGTPVENRLGDLWSIMNLVNPGLLGTAHQFGERFAGPIEKQRDTATRQRLRRLVSPFLLRRP